MRLRLTRGLPHPGAAEHPGHAELGDDLEGLHGLHLVDLRDAGAAILEDDGGLSEAAADLAAPEQDLLHEGVAPGAHAIEIHLRELRHAVAAERAAVVLRLEPQE